MNEVQDINEGSIFPVHKHNPIALTSDEVAAIIRLAETYDLSEEARMKLLISYRNRKRAAYAKKRNN
jgi:hypothetical protein